MWEEWIDPDIQNELEWQLTKEVEGEWQTDWVQSEHGGHHHVVVECEPLVSN